ncbi:uncharacterized protein BDCG_04190 [Blastomyces dermatitidis ER-3]|uniref:Uncharacterized protein n=1 Tax=Ajellomyces dermatitidis (strain ER-3 / ATCC MYA-2586) TaxID=559297 RepID=A0ABP2EZX6_AJEDR|nr:uncharacterized protein BDCG_04190 [Blastomyces dermatitidis ER-3]EEQ89070.1 hypothetical protein BDCG_04190 [Blastomyces dermatitidis ER-3]
MFRRKRSSAHAPINPNPSPSAQTAAAQAFRASQANATISTAAAAAALRKHTPTPTSVENVQTKRMLQRQLSTSSSKGKVAQQHTTQNGRLYRSSSSGSMSTRSFRDRPPAHTGSITGSSERDISPVPPLPQGFMTHRRVVSHDPSYRAISPYGDSSRSPGPRSPGSPRSPRALSSLPELERQGSRSSINFSYPTHARPNSPPQSPIKKFIAKPLVSDNGRDQDEGPSQNCIAAARSPKIITTPITATARGSQSYPDLSSFRTKYDDLQPSEIESTHAITNAETSTSPEVQDPALSHHMRNTNLGLCIDGENAEQDRYPSTELNQLKTRTTQDYDHREIRAVKQQTPDLPDAHESKTYQTDKYTESGNLHQSQLPGGTTGDAENDNVPLPTESAIDASPSADLGPTLHIPSETLSHGHAHGPSSFSIADTNKERPHSLSPTRTTRFSSHLIVSTTGERLHDPPPRSMSPAKSALKHPTPQSSPRDRTSSNWSKSLQVHSESSDGTSAESDDGRRIGSKKRAPKVSFEDEPEVVGTAGAHLTSQRSGSPVSSSSSWGPGSKYSSISRNSHRFNTSNGNGEDVFNEVLKPRPALPSFGSVRGRRGLIEDHDKRLVHDRPASPRTSTGGNPFGGILQQNKYTRPDHSRSVVPGEPIPPEVTSVEGTGYDSLSESSSSSDLMEDPLDFAPSGDSITSFSPSEVQNASSNSHKAGNETTGTQGQSGSVPGISIHPATPALTDEKTSGEWTRIPGGFPSPMPFSDHEKPQLSIDYARQPRPVTPESLPRSQIHSVPSTDDDESDSSESIYSDAAENLTDLEGDGFGSINAIVDSPVSHVSSYTHTPPPDSPTRSKADKKRSSDISSQRNDPRNSSSPLGRVYTNAPLPAVEEEALPSPVPSGKKEDSEDGRDLLHHKNQQLHPKSDLHGGVSATLDGARVVPTSAKPASSDKVESNGKPTDQSTTSFRNVAQQKGPRSKPSKRTPNDTTPSYDKEYTSQNRNDPSSTNRPIENGHPPPGVAGSDFGFVLKDRSQSAVYDSDSSSSFKRTRRSPRSTTHYTLKRTLRGPSDTRPYSSGGYSIGIAGRSTPPTPQRRPFSSDHNLPVRTTLRGPGDRLHAKSSSFSSFGKSLKLKRVQAGLSPHTHIGVKSRYPLSHANNNVVGFARPFRSRYEDSSEDELVPTYFSPVRGIPKRKDGVDGDSTDLEDSSDEEVTKKVLLRRAEPCRRSIFPSNGQARPAPVPDTITDGVIATDATNEPTSVIPNAPGAFLPQLPKRQGSIFNRLGRSRYRGNGEAKIRKSELDSAARRDSPLERPRFELLRNKSSRSSRNGNNKLLSSNVGADDPIPPTQDDVEKVSGLMGSGSWPLGSYMNAPVNISAPVSPISEKGEPDLVRPGTANDISPNNDNTFFRASIPGPTLPAPESSSSWTSRFRPRLQNRRRVSSTFGEDSSVSAKSDAGARPDEKKKRKKFSLLKKAFRISSRE